MKRITPDQVIEAYQLTGWKPIQDDWIDKVNGQICGCGLAVLIGDAEKVRNFDSDIEYRVADELGLSVEYVTGFVQGFDGGVMLNYFTGEHKAGYEDGRAAWEAVKAEGLLPDGQA